MSKIDEVRAAMVAAMKAKDKVRKDSLSMLLSALKNAEIDKRSPLTEEEENAVVKKELRQSKETYDLAPEERQDIREEMAARIAVYKEFAPEDMSAEQIAQVIQEVLAELGIEKPVGADKGKIMKVLMPRVKGKADGKLVNETLAGMMKFGMGKLNCRNTTGNLHGNHGGYFLFSENFIRFFANGMSFFYGNKGLASKKCITNNVVNRICQILFLYNTGSSNKI